MVTSCKTAISRYVIALEEAKKSRKSEAANNKRKIIADKIDSVKLKWMETDARVFNHWTKIWTSVLTRVRLAMTWLCFWKQMHSGKPFQRNLDKAIMKVEEDL